MRHFKHLIASCAICVVAGCSSTDSAGETALPQITTPKKQTAKKEDVALPALAEIFAYSPVGKRDPFRSYLSDLAEQNNAHHPERKLEETEYFEVDQYRLTGLITGISQPKAMLEDPDGRGHVVHIGSRIGKNGGLVSQIAPHGLLIIEETHDAMGKLVRLPITLKLPQTEFDDIANR
jgi:type IV pilus assembly protein PilP